MEPSPTQAAVPSVEQTMKELRRQQKLAADEGATDRAALLHLLIVIEELSETVGKLHERVDRLERRVYPAARMASRP
jgi:hypothetical protein